MLDHIIKSVFEKKKTDVIHMCPGPEILAAYIDGLLTGKEKLEVESHLIDCDFCLEGVILSKTMEQEEEFCQTSQEVVDVVVRFIKDVVKVISKIKEVKILPEPEPVPVRREKKASSNIARFIKEFKEFTAKVEIERLDSDIGKIRIRIVKDDYPLDDVRVTLLKNDKELASYLTEEGCVVFENVHFDNYEIRFFQKALFKGKILLKVKDG